ncbi:MAG: DUF6457 domain-containing protein [Chloroflexota bacterium]
MADAGPQMTAAEWIAHFADELPTGSAGVPSAEEQRLILELSRIAAHSSERIAAPIASYMVGTAVASLSAEERADRIRRLVEEQEKQASRS